MSDLSIFLQRSVYRILFENIFQSSFGKGKFRGNKIDSLKQTK